MRRTFRIAAYTSGAATSAIATAIFAEFMLQSRDGRVLLALMSFFIGIVVLSVAYLTVSTAVEWLCDSVSALRRFPKLWELFRYLLPKRVQDAVWEPTFWELMEDYYSIVDRLEGRKWRTRWIVACFTLRTILMYVQCLRAFAADATVGMLWRTVSRIFRR